MKFENVSSPFLNSGDSGSQYCIRASMRPLASAAVLTLLSTEVSPSLEGNKEVT